jgi:hypothetical protein
MTGTMAGSQTGAPPNEPAPRRLTPWVVSALVVLLVASWFAVAAHQRAQVRVWYDALPVQCSDGTWTVADLDVEPDPLYAVLIDLAPELSCHLRIQVENRGFLPVRLASLELPFHGPSSRMGPLARELSPLGVGPSALDPDGFAARDAVYRLDHRLEPGERLLLTIDLTLSPNVCMEPDARSWVDDAPLIEVAVLGHRGIRHPDGAAFAYRGTEDSAC